MKAITRVLIAMVASIAALFVSTGTSNAGLDNELSVVDGQGRVLRFQLAGQGGLSRARQADQQVNGGHAFMVRSARRDSSQSSPFQ